MSRSRACVLPCPDCRAGYSTVRGLAMHIKRAHPADEVRLRIRAFTDASAGPAACHPWLGRLTDAGYAVITIDRYPVRVGRWLLGLDVGDPTLARHTCDNPPCVNRLHVISGSSADNAADMVARGRSLTGESNPGGGKLTVADVAEIRAALLTSEARAAIGRRFGVTGQMISRIERGRAWTTAA